MCTYIMYPVPTYPHPTSLFSSCSSSKFMGSLYPYRLYNSPPSFSILSWLHLVVLAHWLQTGKGASPHFLLYCASSCSTLTDCPGSWFLFKPLSSSHFMLNDVNPMSVFLKWPKLVRVCCSGGSPTEPQLLDRTLRSKCQAQALPLNYISV